MRPHVEPTADQVARAWEALAARCAWTCTREAAMANALQRALLHGEAVRLAEREAAVLASAPRPKPHIAIVAHVAPEFCRTGPLRSYDWKRAAAGERDDD